MLMFNSYSSSWCIKQSVFTYLESSKAGISQKFENPIIFASYMIHNLQMFRDKGMEKPCVNLSGLLRQTKLSIMYSKSNTTNMKWPHASTQ